MMFEKSRVIKNCISRFLFGIYFFALFSQNFHQHDFSSLLKNLQGKKTENTISKTDFTSEKGGCLACHFMMTGHTVLPQDISLVLISHSKNTHKTLSLQNKIWSQTKFSFHLRGPPDTFSL